MAVQALHCMRSLNRHHPACPGMGCGQALQREDILRWVEANRHTVPNLGRLYNKMVNGGTDGHYVHAYYARKLHGCEHYKITDIEATAGGHDVDIQLDDRINIQVWHGMNTYGHIVESLLKPGTPKSEAIGQHLGTSTELGGVTTDFESDEEKIRAKLAQLPDDAPGILLLHGGPRSYDIPIPPKDMPANKCIINVNSATGMAELHCSPQFRHLEDAKGVVGCLGLGLANKD